MTRTFLALGTVLLLTAPRSATAQERGAAALGELVSGLEVSARVLVIAAHPDDEDTRLIAWLARGRHVETAYLSLTRGDGGQNLIGNELGEALGVIRTEELLAARRIDGAHQYFARAYDFGFSKSAEETFRHWPHDSLLKDVVTVVRAFRPHVIVSVFSGTPRDGHGQHQAAGILAREAFDTAMDTVRLPRSATAGLGGWTPLKFYRSTSYRNGEGATLTYNAGEYSPLLGESYAEIAAESRSQHKSQGFGALRRKGYIPGSLRREASRVSVPEDATQERSIFEGIDTTWARIRAEVRTPGLRATVDSVSRAIAEAQRTLDLFRPATVVAPLGRALALIDRALSTGPEGLRPDRDLDAERSLRDGRERVARALLAASGIAIEATGDREIVGSGASASNSDSLAVTVRVYNRGAVPIPQPVIEWSDSVRASTTLACRGGCAVVPSDSAFEQTLVTRSSRPITQPWWLRSPRRGDMFSGTIVGKAEDKLPAPFEVAVAVALPPAGREGAGEPVRVIRDVPVVYRYADPVRGEINRPVSVAPVISLSLDRAIELAPAGTALVRDVQVKLRSAAVDSPTVKVSLRLPRGLTADSASRSVTLAGYGATRVVAFHVRGTLPPGHHAISAVAESGGQTFTSGYTPIEYEHIRPQRLYRDAVTGLEAVDVKLPRRLNVAYIPGVGDNVAPMLQQLGVPLTVLDPAKLATTSLAPFTTVVVGPRAYESHPDLAANNAKLLEWVRDGGTMVVQYGQFEMMQPGIMPYPITLDRPAFRVTVESAPVRVLRPDHPLLNWPNKITDADWRGWVQERSLYMPTTFDEHYKPLVSMNDPGESPNSGALLVAPYGRGTYVYTTLSLFRQLPAGVPGAARLFVNLLGAKQEGVAATKAFK